MVWCVSLPVLCRAVLTVSIVLTHFQIEVFLFMVGQLTTRTSGEFVARAWGVVEGSYHYYDELFDFSMKAHVAIGMRVMQAWRARERALREATGSPPQTPAYIVRLEGLVTAYESRNNTPSTSAGFTDLKLDPGTVSTNTTEEESAWDQMLGFIDAGNINWDGFAGEWGAQGPPYPSFGSAVGGFNGTSWI